MDKVIIDGIDVSACEHYRAEIETKMPYGEYEIQKGKCHYSGIEVIQNCKGNKGCIYKQLKRLQAENEQIKKDYAKLHIDFAKCNGENEQLKQEVEDLNFYIDSYRQTWVDCKTYRQALQEIKNIAERTDGHHPASVINMVSVIRHTINSVIGEK